MFCGELFIFEPNCEPRSLPLLIDKEIAKHKLYPAFNEDGSLHPSYNIFLEKSESKSSLIPSGTLSKIALSPEAENVLKGSTIVRNEKKAARNLRQRTLKTQNKEKMKQRKLKNKSVKQFFSDNIFFQPRTQVHNRYNSNSTPTTHPPVTKMNMRVAEPIWNPFSTKTPDFIPVADINTNTPFQNSSIGFSHNTRHATSNFFV